MNKLLRNHWFDNQMAGLLERQGFLTEHSSASMERICRLAAACTGAPVSMILLADYRSFKFWTDQPYHPETLDQLCDLAHVLKEVEPEFGLTFYEEQFFKDSDFWSRISDIRYFNRTELLSADGQPLAWICVFDRESRITWKQDFHLLEQLGLVLTDELSLRRSLGVSRSIQDDIIQVAAHDLRNPLTGILGISEHISNQKDNPEALQEISGMIQHSARRMLNMLEEILKSGSLESGKIQLKVSPASFHDLLLQSIHNHQAEALRKGQHFQLDLDETDMLTLLDRGRMLEVLDNLLSNAVKYAPKGAEIEARTRICRENSCLEFSLYNPGVGLSEEDKGRIFQKFSRLSARPTGGESSTGLGLSIARTLTEMHGGSIKAESNGIDQGVRFIMQLPLSRIA